MTLFPLTWPNHPEVLARSTQSWWQGERPSLDRGSAEGQRDRELVLTCLKQQQYQQQAGAHGQIAPTLGYVGVQLLRQ